MRHPIQGLIEAIFRVALAFDAMHGHDWSVKLRLGRTYCQECAVSEAIFVPSGSLLGNNFP